MTLWWRGRGQAVARRRRYGRLRAAAGPGQSRPGGRHAGDSQKVSAGTLAHDRAKGSSDRVRRHPFWAQASTTIHFVAEGDDMDIGKLSLIHISEPTRRTPISYAVFCLKKKKKHNQNKKK